MPWLREPGDGKVLSLNIYGEMGGSGHYAGRLMSSCARMKRSRTSSDSLSVKTALDVAPAPL